MKHTHQSAPLSLLGNDPIGTMEDMTVKKWRDSGVFAVDDRILWTLVDDEVVIHYREEGPNEALGGN